MSECVYIFQRVYSRYVSQTLLRVMYAQPVSKNMHLCGFAGTIHVSVCVGRFSILVGMKCLKISLEKLYNLTKQACGDILLRINGSLKN